MSWLEMRDDELPKNSVTVCVRLNPRIQVEALALRILRRHANAVDALTGQKLGLRPIIVDRLVRGEGFDVEAYQPRVDHLTVSDIDGIVKEALAEQYRTLTSSLADIVQATLSESGLRVVRVGDNIHDEQNTDIDETNTQAMKTLSASLKARFAKNDY